MVSQKVGPSVMLENHGVYWCHSRLKTAGNVVRVLVTAVAGLGYCQQGNVS